MIKEPENRIDCLKGKKELFDEDIEILIDFHHEYPDMKSLKKYTDKSYRELTIKEKNSLIYSLLTDEEYLKYKNCYIAKSKLLYDSSETLIKEITALSRLNDLGYEVYLLPYAYARDSMNFYQKSADSITLGDFLEIKTVVSTGKKAGYNGYKDARHQADNIYLSFVNDVTEKNAINNIYRAIGGIKEGNKKLNNEDNFSGYIFLNFEKKDYTALYKVSKNGKVIKVKNFKSKIIQKNKGVTYCDSQVEENPMTKHGSSPCTSISQKNIKSTSKTSIFNKKITKNEIADKISDLLKQNHNDTKKPNVNHKPNDDWDMN